MKNTGKLAFIFAIFILVGHPQTEAAQAAQASKPAKKVAAPRKKQTKKTEYMPIYQDKATEKALGPAVKVKNLKHADPDYVTGEELLMAVANARKLPQDYFDLSEWSYEPADQEKILYDEGHRVTATKQYPIDELAQYEFGIAIKPGMKAAVEKYLAREKAAQKAAKKKKAAARKAGTGYMRLDE